MAETPDLLAALQKSIDAAKAEQPASSTPTTASEDATLSDSVTDSVTSSDGDRGLSEEEREDLCICPPKGHVPGNHVDYCHNHLYDIELLIAARAAQPEGVERVEWRVESESLEDEFGAAEEAARRWVATCRAHPDWEPVTLMRRTVRTVTGPWEVVGDE